MQIRDVFDQVFNLCDFESMVKLSMTCTTYKKYSGIDNTEEYINNNLHRKEVYNFLRKQYIIVLNQINRELPYIMETYKLDDKIRLREQLKKEATCGTIFISIDINNNMKKLMCYNTSYNTPYNNYNSNMDIDVYDMIYYINIILYYIY